MKIFGSIQELVNLVFRKGSHTVTLKPSDTQAASVEVSLPTLAADDVVAVTEANQNLKSKTFTQIGVGSLTLSGNIISTAGDLGLQPSAGNSVKVYSDVILFGSKNLVLYDLDNSNKITISIPATTSVDRFPQIPDDTGNFVLTTANQTLTTKTISGLSNTITDISGSEIVGDITGNAANITATSNSTLTTLSALSLPGSQVTGDISGNASNITGLLLPSKGGTGVVNNDLATLTRVGDHGLTLTTTDTTDVTLPVTGTLATLDGVEPLTNKVISSTGLLTGALRVPVGDESERPSGQDGLIRFNSESNSFEGYSNGDWSGIGGGGTTDKIDQTAHGFSVGDVLYLNGATYAKAIATAANTAEVVGMVSREIDANTFELTLSGEVSGLTGLVAGEVYFLSADTAGALTVTEPSVIGQVSVPVGVASSTTTMYVAPKRGVVVGGVNARAEVALTSGAVTNVQNVGSYDAGELTGWVFISSAAPVRFYLSARFAKSGAGGDFNLSYSTTGDTPPAGFLVDITTTGMIRVTLPAASGSTSVINYALNAPAIGASFPLTVSASQIVGDTNPVGTMLDYAGTTAPTGYLMCDGQSLSTTGTYAALFAVLGYAYGGSGASFNIPDFRGRFARYLDNMGGTAANRDSGRLIGTSQSDLVKEHNVTVEAGASVGNKQFSKLEINDTAFATTAQSGTELLRFAGNIVNDTRNNDTRFTRTVRAGDIDAAETRPINLACTKIIKF